MRAGYMGHLTFISDEIMKLFEGYPETIVFAIKDDVDMESWTAYCSNELKETKDRDQLPLGGLRPTEEMDIPQSDEEDNEDTLDGVAASQVNVEKMKRWKEINSSFYSIPDSWHNVVLKVTLMKMKKMNTING
jgi:hypothetical protein